MYVLGAILGFIATIGAIIGSMMFFLKPMEANIALLRTDIQKLDSKVDALDKKFDAKFDALDIKYDQKTDAIRHDIFALSRDMRPNADSRWNARNAPAAA